jgi:hypothetical protein
VLKNNSSGHSRIGNCGAQELAEALMENTVLQKIE